MTTAIVKSSPNSLAKVDLAELETLSKWAVQSGMFPDVKSLAQAGMKILAGKELGFEPIVSLTGIHFFQGKVVVGATLLASLVKDSGKYEYKVLKLDASECSIQFMKLFDNKWQPMGVPVTYTIKEATAAGLTSKDVWKKHPADMLFATCIRKGTRRYCADLLRGMNSPTSDYDDSEIATTEAAETLPAQAAREEEAAEFTGSPDYIDAEPVPEDDELAQSAQLEELREAAREAVARVSGGDENEVRKLLNGRDIEQMEAEPLRAFFADLQAM